MQEMLPQSVFHPFDRVRGGTISSSQGIEMLVDAFGPLLTHQTESNVPHLEPWHHMTFKKVHFGEHCCCWKRLTVACHERFDLLL